MELDALLQLLFGIIATVLMIAGFLSWKGLRSKSFRNHRRGTSKR
jgi:hypothetical protein